MRQPPILMYHWFRTGGSPAGSRSPQLEITPELFARQMEHLAARGFRGVSLRDALGDARNDTPPRKPVVITFDDGTADFQDCARPCLERLGFTATLFVVTGFVGGRSTWDEALGEPARDLLDWDQLADLHAAGFEIGSHTHTHRVLTSLDAGEAREEMTRSRDVLAERLGTPPAYLAYPRGFYDDEHRRIARETGYRGACGVILRWRDLRAADAYEMRRMTVKGTEGMNRFRLRLRLAGLVTALDGGG